MRAPLTTLLLAGLIAASTAAQITSLDVILAERTTSRSPGLTLVNITTKKSRAMTGNASSFARRRQ